MSTRSSYRLSAWLFLRVLGLIYGIAFISLWVQAPGLIGSKGILPMADYLDRAADALGAVWKIPTVFWIDSGDASLHIVNAAGVLLAVALIIGFFQRWVLLLLWALYLSLASASREFLGYQWDNLLLETGFLALLLAPRQWRPAWPHPDSTPPSKVSLWLLWTLLFKLMFSSGIAKLSSGDPTWRDLSALTFHYETQPLPTWVGWFFHQLPVWFNKLSLVMMFAIELVVPFFIFFPRPFRLFAAASTLFLQGLILLTGNYTFFNWLAIALCLLLIDDAFVTRLLSPLRRRAGLEKMENPPLRSRIRIVWKWAQRAVLMAFATFYIAVSAAQIISVSMRSARFPHVMTTLMRTLSPFRTINRYGLFSVMTTRRPEIIIEGSRDGVTWQAYDFRWKPGDLERRPRFVAPHQPRVDWQMWFAALSDYRRQTWLIRFMERLLLGEPAVVRLLASNPFPDEPPLYVRAVLYEYHFTDWQTLRSTGQWWTREEKGLYSPVLGLRAE